VPQISAARYRPPHGSISYASVGTHLISTPRARTSRLMGLPSVGDLVDPECATGMCGRYIASFNDSPRAGITGVAGSCGHSVMQVRALFTFKAMKSMHYDWEAVRATSAAHLLWPRSFVASHSCSFHSRRYSARGSYESQPVA
jgi:hypothetical protein